MEAGLDSKQGIQADARIGYGLTSWLEAGADAYWDGGSAGLLAGLHGSF